MQGGSALLILRLMLTRRMFPLLAPGLLAAPSVRRASAQGAVRVAMLHLNDFHSRHEPYAAGTAASTADALPIRTS